MHLEINEKVFDEFPLLKTERLLLREFRKQDAGDLFEIRSDDRVMEYMDTYRHDSISDSEIMIDKIIKSFEDKTGINWIVEEKTSQRVIGYIGYWRLMRESVRAEIGYALKPDFWGKGFMKEALLKVIDFGFDKLHLHGIEGNVNPGNLSSIKALEKTGFKKEAHFRENFLHNGKFLDSIIYCLLESDLKNIKNK